MTMKPNEFILVIATDNNAFQPNPAHEVARILRDIATRLEDGTFDAASPQKYQNVALDLNGNVVGRARLA